MKKYPQEQFNKGIEVFQHVALSEEKKDTMLASILSGEEQTSTDNNRKKKSSHVWIGGLGALFVLGFSGVAFAAQESVPGDFLYPLETEVLEPVQELLQVSPEAKYVYHTKRAQERIREVKEIQAIYSEQEAESLQEIAQEEFAEHIEELELLEINTTLDSSVDLLEAFENLIEDQEEEFNDIETENTEPETLGQGVIENNDATQEEVTL